VNRFYIGSPRVHTGRAGWDNRGDFAQTREVTTPRLRIYGIARTRAFRVLWMAHELSLDYEHIAIETGPEGARLPEYLAVNPNGRLPAIDDDGFVMWESLAINLYLAKKHAAGTLYPASPQGEAKAWQWSLWAANEVERGVNVWSFHAVRLPPAERDPRIAADAVALLKAPFAVLEQELGDRPHLLGDDFTVADLNLAAVMGRAIEMDLSATPRIARWLGRCLDRPAAKVAQKMRAAAEASASIEATRAAARRNRL
jgi:glutathione S-transferase